MKMSNNNVINDKKKALLAYKEKILDEIKYYERSIDDFRANHKSNTFCDDYADSSDSEDDFPCTIDTGPSITQLKLQQAMMKTCLHATQELTSLMILQSEVDVLVEQPKFEGERPVTEPGTWREVTAECRIDLVPFTMTFFMHTPDRKFAPPSYRSLRVVPVKSTHELELSSSVLHSLRVPSDAVEVLRSYAAGYRSRRTTLARLANKYTNALYMEPHTEGGFVLKCADLLEVSWRLENKWSPVAPFHHRMKFDLEYMDESYIKIITQAHKQLLDPALQTDERTLLLAKILTTCLEARGPIDPESDLESKTTERENDIDKRDSENEKRDSEVMAPPKSLPKKGKQKNRDSLPSNAVKRSMEDDNGLSGAKKMKSNVPNEPKKSIVDDNPRKTKMSDVTENGKKRKINEVDKVAVDVKDTGDIGPGNTKSNNVKETEGKTDDMADDINTNIKATKPTKSKVIKEKSDTAPKNANSKTKNIKEPANTKPKTKAAKETTNNQKLDGSVTEDKTKNDGNKDNELKDKLIGTVKAKNVNKAKTVTSKESENPDEVNKEITKTIVKKKINNVAKGKSKENIDSNKDADHPKSKYAEKNTDDKNMDTNAIKNGNKAKTTVTTSVKKVASAKNEEQTIKAKKVASAKNDEQITKTKKVASAPNNEPTTKAKKVASAKNDEQTTKTKKIVSAPINEPTTKAKNVASAKGDERTSKAKNTTSAKNDDQTTKGKNVASTKNYDQTTKAKTVASAKNDEQTTKKSEGTTNVANSKNDEQVKKAAEKMVKNKEKLPENVANKVSEKIVEDKILKVKNVAQTVKKVTEKNATNRIKDKISQITEISEKNMKDKPPIQNVPNKVLNSNLISKNTKEVTNNKNTIKKPIIHKIASHRNSLKPQNPPKMIKAGNIKAVSTGNTEKENGGKVTKIPLKKSSIISEGSSKKNMLRMSPRQIPSKFKTLSQETFKQKMVKSTNIPRLLKKPTPKVI